MNKGKTQAERQTELKAHNQSRREKALAIHRKREQLQKSSQNRSIEVKPNSTE